MSCPCGSSICDCRLECLCIQDQCQCNKCSLLPKICSRCNLPFYIIVHQRENVNNICSCKTKSNPFPSESHPLSQNSAAYNGNTISSIRKTQCPRCSLPIIIVTKSEDYHSEDYHTLDSCCCSHKNSDSNTTGTPPTEHETSNCTSDHRNVTEERKTRKTSRRTRTEKSNWQYKKVTDKHLTNSGEDKSDTETIASEEFLVEDSSNLVQDNPELRVPCAGSVKRDLNLQNLNFDSSTRSLTGVFSSTGDNSIGNVSLLANASGFSSPSASKDFSFPPESPVFFQLSQNVRPKLPPPFPTLPKPVPGLPAFRNCSGRDSLQQMKTSRLVHPPVVNQPALARVEKLEKWFGSFQDGLTTSGELPNVETAAVLNKGDKGKIGQQPNGYSDCQANSKPAEKYIEPFKSSKNTHSGSMPYLKSATNNQEEDKQLDVIDPTTDIERSSSLSKSRKESESD